MEIFINKEIGCNPKDCEEEMAWIQSPEPLSPSDDWVLKYDYECESCHKYFCKFHALISFYEDGKQRKQQCELCWSLDK